MKRTIYALSILALIISTLMFVGCSNKDEASNGDVAATEDALSKISEWSAEARQNMDENQSIVFRLYIDGCSCSKHSSFDITWDSPLIKADTFKQMLINADEQGLLLCDCHEDKGDLLSVVAAIEPLFRDDRPGLRIKLKQDVWLYKYDITEKLEPLFNSHADELFEGHYFKII